jgi:hypothetical protein
MPLKNPTGHDHPVLSFVRRELQAVELRRTWPVPGESAARRSRSLVHRRNLDPRRGAPGGLKQLTLKTENKQRMKSTLVAVALVLAILYGLKAFTRAVARPIERVPVTCAKAQDSNDLMPCAMKLLNGGSLEEVAAELMKPADTMSAAPADKTAPPTRPLQPEPGFLQKAWAQVKTLRSANALHLRGIITGPKPLIIVNHVTLAPGEEARIPLVGHHVTVRCLHVTAQWARISVNGKPDTLYLTPEHGAPVIGFRSLGSGLAADECRNARPPAEKSLVAAGGITTGNSGWRPGGQEAAPRK